MSSTAYDRMAPDQRTRFQARVEGLGVPLAEALNTSISTAGATKPVVLSMDLERTLIPPRIAVVKDIAMLKGQGGVPDALYASVGLSDKEIKYPLPWDRKYTRMIDKAGSRSELAALLGPALCKQVRQAMDAWMLGNSAKVKDYEAVINALHFPVYAANWTMASICVAANTTLVLTPPPDTPDPPTLVVTGGVCIEQGGVVQFQVPVSLEVHGNLQLLPAGGCNCQAPSAKA